ncbi:MAG: hypothetical protein ACFE8L_08760 [Candidatus Hodarchaeota archaeon]
MTEEPKKNKDWEKYESFVVTLGKWAWIIVLINAIATFFYGIWVLVWEGRFWWIWRVGVAYGIYLIASAVLIAVLAFIIVKPRFSDKCAAKDWDYIFNDVLVIGNARIPWMLIIGIVLEIFGLWWWGGLAVLIPMIILLAAGPKPYKWKK